MPAPYDGGCICGAIRYRAGEEPLTYHVCHCTDCQRHTGTAFAESLVVRRRSFEVLRGSPRTYTVAIPNGHTRRGSFCGECSTRLWGDPIKLPDVVILRPGTLDDRQGLRPVAHIWTRSAQPWVAIPADVAAFEAQPPDPNALVALWRERHPR
jgi:hypothetical protein